MTRKNAQNDPHNNTDPKFTRNKAATDPVFSAIFCAKKPQFHIALTSLILYCAGGIIPCFVPVRRRVFLGTALQCTGLPDTAKSSCFASVATT